VLGQITSGTSGGPHMADGSTVDWETCGEDGCIGVQLPSGGRCWVHGNGTEFGAARQRLSNGGTFDGRGVTFTATLLRLLLDTTPHNEEGPVVSGALFQTAAFEDDAGFDGATFKGDARFDGATFKGQALFTKATFTGGARFDGATFRRGASFDRATFTGLASFDYGTTFTGGARFDRATFMAQAWFNGALFTGATMFDGATFTGNALFEHVRFTHANFERATFAGEAWFAETHFEFAQFAAATFTAVAIFGGATFAGEARFPNATFAGNASFAGATIGDDAWFADATFERARELGPMLVGKCLDLERALFRERIQIEVSAARLSCKHARFLAGVQLQVRWAQVVLDDADLAGPSVLSGANRFEHMDDGDWPRAPGSSWPVDPYGTPRLLSVWGADVAGLTVGAVDLQACRFVDAHHLDQLRAEGSNFPNTPRGWRWTKRRTIAEEHQWRASENHQGWYGPENQPPDWLELKELTPGQGGLLLPGEIAPLYRDLRKGLEDKKDEPGAADFYYGEMEMRRHSKRQDVHLERTLRFRNGGFGVSAAAEYAILSLYWLVSGYGLRAWRALTSLTAVVVVASFIFAFWGFAAPDQPAFRAVDVDSEGTLVYERQQVDQPTGWDELPTALRYSAQATTALLRGPDVRALTAVGEWTQIALRLIGPVLLGLAVLSVRGRVKR
jgi:uncharacterized protein YjbI with pentapeptide repeats